MPLELPHASFIKTARERSSGRQGRGKGRGEKGSATQHGGERRKDSYLLQGFKKKFLAPASSMVN